MSDRQSKLHELLLQNLAELNLTQIAATYREVLDEAARRNSSMLEVLSSLVASEMTSRRQKALQRRILQAKLPKLKTLAEYKFEFPKRIPKQKIMRLFDCEFIEQHQCAINLSGRQPVDHVDHASEAHRDSPLTGRVAQCGHQMCFSGARRSD